MGSSDFVHYPQSLQHSSFIFPSSKVLTFTCTHVSTCWEQYLMYFALLFEYTLWTCVVLYRGFLHTAMHMFTSG